MRLFVAILLLAWTALAANVRLYLKDGGYHIVREYEVRADRVRFYSVERGQWEEVPLDLIDLKRTETEIRERQAALEEEAKAVSSEETAERLEREEIARVPVDTGVYLVSGQELKPVKQAEAKVVTSKRRSILKVLTPVPIVAGKASVEIDGERSQAVVTTPRPEFYIRLAAEERFGILRLTPKKDVRVVEKWNIVPVTNEIFEEHEDIKVFRRQIDDGLYKIWPVESLQPGEYAVVEFTEGKGNIQVWDFSCRPSGQP